MPACVALKQTPRTTTGPNFWQGSEFYSCFLPATADEQPRTSKDKIRPMWLVTLSNRKDPHFISSTGFSACHRISN